MIATCPQKKRRRKKFSFWLYFSVISVLYFIYVNALEKNSKCIWTELLLICFTFFRCVPFICIIYLFFAMWLLSDVILTIKPRSWRFLKSVKRYDFKVFAVFSNVAQGTAESVAPTKLGISGKYLLS